MVSNGFYLYTDHLLSLNSFIDPSSKLTSSLALKVFCPLIISQWTKELYHHPDRAFSSYILQGIEYGFRIGFNRSQILHSATVNLPSQNSSVISDYLQREVSLNRMWKYPHLVSPPGIHISPIGVIPKKNKPGKWRLIVDLSSPRGFSVNDGISPDLSTLSYTSVDHLASLVLSNGRGAFLVKADIKEAYRMIPIHPDDQHLLGVHWNGCVYLDRMLPFGLRSAPKIFTAVADALQWILIRHGVSPLLHYLDDFILVADTVDKARSLKNILVTIFEHLGVPLELSKLEGPSTHLSFLGIEIDTESLLFRLPPDKLDKMKSELSHCVLRRSVTKRELQSLVGLLQFATKVIRPGRPFLRRLYAMQDIGSHPDHHIRLNGAAKADILWWHVFASQWNGISMLWDLDRSTPDVNVFSDASGSWGCGAYWGSQWFHFPWPPCLQSLPIATKELIPVVVAAAIFGHHWHGQIAKFTVDNMAVVHVLKATYCKDLHIMHLIRILVFLAARFNFWFVADHIIGKENSLADHLSRNKLCQFFSQVPQARQYHPPDLPDSLIDLLSSSQLDWTSKEWLTLFSTFVRQF